MGPQAHEPRAKFQIFKAHMNTDLEEWLPFISGMLIAAWFLVPLDYFMINAAGCLALCALWYITDNG